jgi:hypothetical protein
MLIRRACLKYTCISTEGPFKYIAANEVSQAEPKILVEEMLLDKCGRRSSSLSTRCTCASIVLLQYSGYYRSVVGLHSRNRSMLE